MGRRKKDSLGGAILAFFIAIVFAYYIALGIFEVIWKLSEFSATLFVIQSVLLIIRTRTISWQAELVFGLNFIIDVAIGQVVHALENSDIIGSLSSVLGAVIGYIIIESMKDGIESKISSYFDS